MSDLQSRLTAIVGAANVITDDFAPYANDWRKKYFGKPLLVVKPGSAQEVAAVVKLCAETKTPVVPQAGNTGLVGGGVPDESGHEVIISVARMDKVLEIDTINNTMTVEAGCILQTIQEKAAESASTLNPIIHVGRTIVVSPKITGVTFSQDPYARYVYLKPKN